MKDDPKKSIPLIALALIASAMLALIIAPFFAPLFLAAVFAATLMPTEAWLAERLGARRWLAAGMITTAAALVIIVPLIVVGVVVTEDLTLVVNDWRGSYEEGGADALIAKLPKGLRETTSKLVERSPAAVRERAVSTAGNLASGVLDSLAATASALVEFLFSLIALYFMLIDGPQLLEWVYRTSPLGAERTRRFAAELRRVGSSVLISTIATAALQTGIAVIGYLVVDLPRIPIVALVTFLCAFIPVVGAGSVVVLAAGYLYLEGDVLWAVILALWGLIAVGLSDNLVKTFLLKEGLRINGIIVFFSLLGGLAAFGPLGLIAGPMVVTLFLSALRMLNDPDDELNESAAAA